MWWRRAVNGGGLLKRFKKSQEGVTAIEFAMVGGPFLYLLGVIFETGLMLFSEYVIENGVSQAARMIRTGQAQASNMSAADFKSTVCGRMAAFLDCNNKLHIDVRKFTAFADVNMPNPTKDNELSDDVTKNAQFQPGGPMEVVVVRAYYEWKLFMPGISALANISGGRRLLSSGAAFRNEPYN
ncbi:pilus assembly protein [soil metagenome]